MIETYNEVKHYELLKGWIEKRGLCPMPPRDFFPPTGFVKPGLAACFLLLTNCSIAFMEHVITNPDADKKEREIALNEIGAAIVEQAKQHDVKMLIGFSKFDSLKKRGSYLGFKLIDMTVLVKEI